jgi:transposase-like protein
MTKTQVEVITSVQRGRRWPRAKKERIVAAAMEPEDGPACISYIAIRGMKLGVTPEA